VKDKPLYSGKVREEGKRNLRGKGNEVRPDGMMLCIYTSILTF